MDLNASCPSTLTYKERLTLKQTDGINYARLYDAGSKSHVWARLTTDASVRTSRRALTPTPHGACFAEEPRSSFCALETHSGFVSNTSPKVWDEHLTLRTGHLQAEGTPYERHPLQQGVKTLRPLTTPMASRSQRLSVESLHPLEVKRFKQRNPLDYFAAIRPDTQSVNQTLRMMGTYDTDHDFAARSQSFIPSFSPGGPAWFHADVTMSTPPTARRSQRV